MKTILMKATIIFFYFLLIFTLKAQEKKEIKLKIIQEKNGEITKIDTTIFKDSDARFYLLGNKNNLTKEELDSLLKNLHINFDDDSEIFSFNTEKTGNTDFKTWYYISSDDSINVFSNDNENTFTITENNSDKVKLIHIKKEKQDESDGENKVIVYKSNGEELEVLSEEDSFISEIVVDAHNDINKTFEFIFKEGEESEINIKELEDNLFANEDNIIITKEETEDGKLIIKAQICSGELCDKEKKQLKELGIEDNNELEFIKFKIYPNPSDGIFKLEFELEDKSGIMIKVYNETGNTVFTDKVKRFNGSYISSIDLSGHEPGTYFLQLVQGKKSLTRKLIKK